MVLWGGARTWPIVCFDAWSAARMPTGTRVGEEVIQYREALDDVTRQLEGSGIGFTIREYVRGRKPAKDLSSRSQTRRGPN